MEKRNKEWFERFRKRMNKAVEEVASEFGITAKEIGNITYNPARMWFKLEFCLDANAVEEEKKSMAEIRNSRFKLRYGFGVGDEIKRIKGSEIMKIVDFTSGGTANLLGKGGKEYHAGPKILIDCVKV